MVCTCFFSGAAIFPLREKQTLGDMANKLNEKIVQQQLFRPYNATRR